MIDVKDIVSGGGNYSAVGRNGGAGGVSLALGGDVHGVPDISSISALLSTQAYVPKNIIALVISNPEYMDYLDNVDEAKVLKEQYKALWEKAPNEISGLKAGLTVSSATTGRLKAKTPTGVQEIESSLASVITERPGLPVFKLLNHVVEYGIGDKYGGRALVTKEKKYKDAASKYPGGSIPTHLGGSIIIYIQPTPDYLSAELAWLAYDIYPEGTGELEGKMNMTEEKSNVDHNITWASTIVQNKYVLALADIAIKKMTSGNDTLATSSAVDGVPASFKDIDFK